MTDTEKQARDWLDRERSNMPKVGIPKDMLPQLLAEYAAVKLEEAAQIADKEAAVPREDGGSISRTDACLNVAAGIRHLK